jgi:opacity protein-like surface antigen
MKKNIFLTLLLIATLSLNAQDSTQVVVKEKSFKPIKKNFTFGINLGSSTYDDGLFMDGASFTTPAVSGDPTKNNITISGGNPATNMIGAEARYFMSTKWALTLSGAIHYSNTPASLNIPAVGDFPAYNAVVSDESLQITYALGALYFFDYKKNDRLMPYLGFIIPATHSYRSQYDPTIEDDGSIRELGSRTVEATGVGFQAVAGIDYFLTENFYFGLSIKPASFIFVKDSKYPGPGLFSRKISSTSFSSFVEPQLRLGFKL